MNKDEIWEFNKQPEVQEYSDQLTDEFDKYRIFGDNRDFTNINIIRTHATQSNVLCFVHKISPRIRPDLVTTPDNVMMLCEYCVLEFIKAFKTYRNQHKLSESNY